MEISDRPSECAHDIEQKSVCSSDVVVEKMRVFAKQPAGVSKENAVQAAAKKTGCITESCVLNNRQFVEFAGENVIKMVLNMNFKPSGPSDSFDWLSNSNIDQVLDQVERKYKDKKFLHIPFQMRDFEKTKMTNEDVRSAKERLSPFDLERVLMKNLANIDFAEKYKLGIRRFGVVFNTDASVGRGQHWYSLYGDMSTTPIVIEYFNSSGEQPQSEIQIWLDMTKHRLQKDLGKDVKVVVCAKQHQTDEHSCGAYALYYIMSRLSGIPYQTFHDTLVPDELMHKFRKHLFRREKLLTH